MGSKNRIAKHILPIMLEYRKEGQWWVEPFVGGANMIGKVDGVRIGGDTNVYLIELFRAIQLGWEPPNSCTEEEYNQIRKHKDLFPMNLVGFVGIGCSYSGKWFGGYARGKDNKGKERNYCLESKKNIMAQKDKIQTVDFRHGSYLSLPMPKKCIIYCDPPYEKSTKYKDKFNHVKFWQWCRDMAKEGHTVFISEYNAPDDFECIWSKEIVSSLTKNTGGKTGVEKLFKIKEVKSE